MKVLNVSSRSAVEIRAELARVTNLNVAGGQITSTTDFHLERDHLFVLPGRSKNPEDQAFRFITGAPIEDEWTEGRYLIFTLSAKDALTGFGQVFRQRYYLHVDVIKQGNFELGDSMRIA